MEKEPKEQTQEKKPVELKKGDDYEFDCLFFGTGLIESAVSGGFSTYKKLSLNIECEKQYSGNYRTLSINELRKFIEETEENPYLTRAISNFEHEFTNPEIKNFEQFIEVFGRRAFNIDFSPKLIYSTSSATDMMVQAHIDNYISFRVLKGIYTLHNGKVEDIPTHKGDIFKSGYLNLFEKKELFNFLSVAMRYYKKEFVGHDEQNSINDFKKNVYSEHHKVVDALSGEEDLKNQHFIKFLTKSGLKSPKLVRLIAYCLCNFRVNPYTWVKETHVIFEDQSTTVMLKRLAMFVESLNVQSRLPYLYPIYGCGDITQIFSRISSVYGGIFMLDSDFDVKEYSYKEGELKAKEDTVVYENKIEEPKMEEIPETEEKKEAETPKKEEEEQDSGKIHDLKFVVHNGLHSVKAKKVFIGGQYLHALPKIFGKPIPEPKDDPIIIQRTVAILKLDEDDNENTIFPFLIQIPDSNPELENSHPISVMFTNSICGSCPKKMALCYISSIVKDETTSLSPITVDHILKAARLKFPKLGFHSQFVFKHKEKSQNFEKIELEDGITILPDPNADLDMESVFLLAHKIVTKSEDLEKPLFDRKTINQSGYGPEDEVEEDDEANDLLKDLEEFDF